MTSKDQTVGSPGHLSRALEHLSQDLERQLLPGPTHQVEPEQWSRSHSIDVAQGVGGSDGTPG